MKTVWLMAMLVAATAAAGADSPAPDSGADEWRVKRKEVFAFTEKPAVTREGDKFTIAFAVKDFCDVTVAIEDTKGKILRYLASGVLGPNAPEPLQKGSLRQTIVWDGKDEQGAYVDDQNRTVVRVSLGLKPRYERRLYWSPYRKSSYDVPAVVCPTPEGVYFYENGYPGHERLLFMDHQGNYVRTIYPFAADKLAEVKGLLWRTMPQTGENLPLRNGLAQATLLSTGDLAFNVRWPTAGGNSALGMAVRGSRILLAGERINRLATDGTSGGQSLQGPKTSIPVYVPTSHAWKGGVVEVAPSDLAVSPDGKWIYLTGYMWKRAWNGGGIDGVARMAADGDGPLEAFAGDLGKVTGAGKVEQPFLDGFKAAPKAAAAFQMAVSLDVDAQGRVYVADNGGDRIQVFDASGKHLKNIAVKRPAVVRVHPKTGELYVFSFSLVQGVNDPKNTVSPTFFRLGPLDDPVPRIAIPLGVQDVAVWSDGPAARAGVDFWTDPPTIWLAHPGRDASYVNSNWDRNGVRLLAEQNGKLTTLRDFPRESHRDTLRYLEPRLARPRIYFNPKSRKLYTAEPENPCVAYQKKEFKHAALIDPDTGRVEKMEPMPFSTEDLAFDQNGFAYLRTENLVVRYDPETWREIPFDYGIEQPRISFTDVKFGRAMSGMEVPSQKGGGWYHLGGMSVSAKGNIAVTCYNLTPVATDIKATPFLARKDVKKYSPQIFPGRDPGWCVQVFDRRGRPLHEDAIPGSTQLSGIGIDRHDNLYAMTLGARVYNGKPYDNVASCTVFKVKPRAARVLSTGNGGSVPIPLAPDARPNRPVDIRGGPYGTAWFENVEWFYGGVGSAPKWIPFAGGGCWCEHSAMLLDDFARSFIPENDTYHIAVLDSNGNLILRIGKYGNVDDGMPLVKEGGSPNPRSLGGDEVPLFLPRFCATETDRRLFISDAGHNCSILSVKLGYHAAETVALKDVLE